MLCVNPAAPWLLNTAFGRSILDGPGMDGVMSESIRERERPTLSPLSICLCYPYNPVSQLLKCPLVSVGLMEVNDSYPGCSACSRV